MVDKYIGSSARLFLFLVSQYKTYKEFFQGKEIIVSMIAVARNECATKRQATK